MIETYRKIWALFTRRERRRFVLLIFLTITMSIFEMISVAGILPFLTVLARPDLIENHWALVEFASFFGLTDPKQVMIALGLMVFCLVVIGMTIRAAVTYVQIRFALARGQSLASRLLHGYLSHDYAWYLTRNTANLSQSLLSEVDLVVRDSILPAVLLISNLITLLLIGGFLFYVAPGVAVVAIGLLFGVYLLAYLMLRNRMSRVGRMRVTANRARFKAVQEITGGLKEIKVMGLEQVNLVRFRAHAYEIAALQAEGLVLARMPRFALEAVVYGGFIAMVLILIVVRGGAIADLLPLLGLLGMSATKLFPALQQLYLEISAIRFSAAALEKLHAEIKESDKMPPFPSWVQTDLLTVDQAIEFSALHFRYPQGEQDTLSDLTLRIDARSTVGIVGGTGAGKTTVIDLLLGLLHPDAGTIVVDGAPLLPDRIRAWQRNIGYVPQTIYLTDNTIAANIAFGIPEDAIDLNQVEEVARIANLHDFILSDLPQGYQTVVGERGVRLSGGQRQRIGIARALYRNPGVLVLDEATSALDSLTERAVIDAVRALGGQKTIIMIAHRLSTVMSCDKIMLLERGQLMAEGSYDDLVRKNDSFRRMAGEA